MYPIKELIKNDTSLVAGFLTLVTGLLTGPIFKLDPAAVGSIVGMMGFALTIWVRASVYSKKGAAQAATVAAIDAVKAVTGESAGPPGEVTAQGAAAIQEAVQAAVPGAEAPVVTTPPPAA